MARRGTAAETTKQDWQTAAKAVADNVGDLRAIATDFGALFQWAKDHKLATKLLFPKFKAELRKQLHVDYDGLREETLRGRVEELLAAAGTASRIELFVAGDAEVSSFAVCNSEGGDPWYGDFSDRDQFDGEQLSADLLAARKAIYLAGQARESAGLEILELTLCTSNHEVCVEDLTRDMLRQRVVVTVNVLSDVDDNPALEICRQPGYRGWREVSVTDLIANADQPEAAGAGEG